MKRVLSLSAILLLPSGMIFAQGAPPQPPAPATQVAARVEFATGDFFSDPLPAGDLFAVGRILHDWSAEKIEKLLARVFDRLPAGGALLIAEKLLHGDQSGPRWAQMQRIAPVRR